MDKRMLLLRRVCRFFYTGNIFLLIMEFLLVLLGRKPLTAAGLAYFWGIALLVTVFRERVTNLLVLFILHAVIAVPVYFTVEDSYVRTMLFFLLAAYFIHSADYLFRGYTDKPVTDLPWPVFLLAVAVIGCGMYMKSSFLLRIGYVIPLILFLLYLVIMYLDGMEKYVNATKNISGIPREKMLQANSILIGGILMTALILIILADFLGFGESLARAGSWLKGVGRLAGLLIGAVMRFLYRFLIKGSYELPEEDSQELSREAGKAVKGISQLDIILKLFIAALAVWLMFRLFRRVMRVFLMRHRHPDEVTERIVRKKRVNAEIREKVPKGEERAASLAERLRRLYRKKILAEKKYYMPGETDTTEDIQKKLLQNDPDLSAEELAELTESYRSVRYGNHVPDRAELKRLSRLLQRR